MCALDRVRADACPGALQTHTAADGPLARVRVPGGVLRREQLKVLAALSVEYGDGAMELTSRANIQLRALSDTRAVAEHLRAAGLLPSDTHERVRNVIVSPLSGRGPGGTLDVQPLAEELDHALCADPELANLPGRFLFTLDDGAGDVAVMGDVGLLGTGPQEATVLLAGRRAGSSQPVGDVTATLIAAARAFLQERATQGSTAWRMSELDNGVARVAAMLGLALGDPLPAKTGGGPVGALIQTDGRHAVGAVVPLGRLTADQAYGLADLGGIRLTPWRSVVLLDLDDPHALSTIDSLGLVTDPSSPWIGVTACAGKPRCAKAFADVRADAAAAVSGMTHRGRVPMHWAGCERRCGRPMEDAVDVLATETGYLVDDTPIRGKT